MAQTISVRLELEKGYIDLNEHGLLSMSFDRYAAGNSSGILSELDIVMYDKTGDTLLEALLQNPNNQIRLRYGFIGDNNDTTSLSEIYTLNILKIKPRWTNRAATIAIGAVATQIHKPPQARYYTTGTPIDAIVKDIANYNNWYLGNNDENVQVKGNIPIDIYKKPGQDDLAFIKEAILPIVEAQYRSTGKVRFYDCRIIGTALGNSEFFFRPKSNKARKVWSYSVGKTTSSSVLDVNADIDLSFLIKGLTIEIPSTSLDYTMLSDDEMENKLISIYENQREYIQKSLQIHNIPLSIPSKLNFKTKIVPPEGSTDDEAIIALKVEDRIIKAIMDSMKAISTMSLVVIGNPKIMPNDLIELDITTASGTPHILSSGPSGSYWEVIKITESIGLDGYKTELTLARALIEQVI